MKTIYRSEGDTLAKVVVNFDTKKKKQIHIHYVGLSRVTTIQGLCIIDLCEDKIAINDVLKEMERLINHKIYQINHNLFYEITQILM